MLKFVRQSFSTNPENTWPYASPLAGYYDVRNSDTKLILLNNSRTYVINWTVESQLWFKFNSDNFLNFKSHLRGKVSAKRESLGKDKNYDWVEREYENKKLLEKNGYQPRLVRIHFF